MQIHSGLKGYNQNLCDLFPQPMSHLTNLFTLTGETRKHENHLFKCHVNGLPEFNQALIDFLNTADLQLIFTLFYDSINFVMQSSEFSSGLLGP